MDDDRTTSTMALANSMGCVSADEIAGFCASAWDVPIEVARDRLNPVTVTLVDTGNNDEMILSVKPHAPCVIHYYEKYIVAVDCSEWARAQTINENTGYVAAACDVVEEFIRCLPRGVLFELMTFNAVSTSHGEHEILDNESENDVIATCRQILRATEPTRECDGFGAVLHAFNTRGGKRCKVFLVSAGKFNDTSTFGGEVSNMTPTAIRSRVRPLLADADVSVTLIGLHKNADALALTFDTYYYGDTMDELKRAVAEAVTESLTTVADSIEVEIQSSSVLMPYIFDQHMPACRHMDGVPRAMMRNCVVRPTRRQMQGVRAFIVDRDAEEAARHHVYWKGEYLVEIAPPVNMWVPIVDLHSVSPCKHVRRLPVQMNHEQLFLLRMRRDTDDHVQIRIRLPNGPPIVRSMKACDADPCTRQDLYLAEQLRWEARMMYLHCIVPFMDPVHIRRMITIAPTDAHRRQLMRLCPLT